mmetsp:Transcript_8269/g.14161  ORF Transcript_8269/g.14161 Transcript_8269/m.14161 type:complete len:135 (-) Transcript_8269:125-529(-)
MSSSMSSMSFETFTIVLSKISKTLDSDSSSSSSSRIVDPKAVQVRRKVGVNVRINPYRPTSGLEHQVTTLQTKLWNLKNHHDYMRMRESAHRDVTEQTFSYVMRWNLVETVTVILMSIAQVLYLRRFFETRRYM